MTIEDIEVLERVTSKYRIRYDCLEAQYKEEIIGTKMYFVINLSKLFNDLYDFKNTLVDDTDFELHCLISIMNLFGHYKHFYKTRADVVRCTVIGYLKDGYTYSKYEKLANMLFESCTFFKDVYFIPKVYDYNYAHVVMTCIQYMDSFSSHKNLGRSIHVFSQYNIDKQIMCAIPTKSAQWFTKNMAGKPKGMSKNEVMNKLFKDPNFYEMNEYKSELEALIVPIGKFTNNMICTSQPKKNVVNPYKVLYNIRNAAEKEEFIKNFFKHDYKPEDMTGISHQFYHCLKNQGVFVSEVDAKNFESYLAVCDFRFKNIGKMRAILAPLINTWKTKIKDYAIARESEQYKILVKHELFVNWLE